MKFRIFSIIIIFAFTFFSLQKVNAEVVSQDLIVNEVFGNPSGTDAGKEWIELYNSSNVEVNLENWKIINTSAAGSTRIFTIGAIIIQPYSYLVLAEESVQHNQNIFQIDLDIFNSNAKLELYNNQDSLIFKMDYEGMPDGKSLELNGPTCNEYKQHPQSNSIGTVNYNFSAECWGESMPRIQNINFVLAGTTQPIDTISKTGSTTFNINFGVSNNQEYSSHRFILEDGTEVSNPVSLGNYFGKKIKIEAVLPTNQQIFGFTELIFIKPNIFISEIYPSPNSSGEESEWIELYNAGEIDINISGWYFTEEVSGNSCTPTSIKLDNQIIKKSTHLVVYNENFSVTLNNSGDEIYLCNDTNYLISKIEYPEIKKGNSFAMDFADRYLETFSIQSLATPGDYTNSSASVEDATAINTMQFAQDPGLYSYTSVLGAKVDLELKKPNTIIHKAQNSEPILKSSESLVVNLVLPFFILFFTIGYLIYKNQKSIKIFYEKFVKSKEISQDYFKHFKKSNAQLFS